LVPKYTTELLNRNTKDFKIMRVLQIIDSLEAGGAAEYAMHVNEIDFSRGNSKGNLHEIRSTIMFRICF
jgi:hypothetical protein